MIMMWILLSQLSWLSLNFNNWNNWGEDSDEEMGKYDPFSDVRALQ